MLFTTNAKILFTSRDNLDDLSDFFENLDLEVAADDDDDKMVALIEDNYEFSSIEDIIDFIRPAIDEYPDATLDITGTLFNQGSNEYVDFQIQYKSSNLRYRQTDAYVDELIDDDMTYTEYEEEGHHNLCEEDFDTFTKHTRDFREVSTRGKFHRWEAAD